MTVSRRRRRMTTARAGIASVVGLILAGSLGAVGYVAIANTTDGEVVGGGVEEVTFPATPTATLAVLDSDGNLASLAVLSTRPGDGDQRGSGGTVVPVPIDADSSGGFGPERLPLNETVALFGPDALVDEVPVLLGVGIDDVVVADEEQLAGLLEPLGPIQVSLPIPIRDASGRELFGAGPQTLGPAEVASVLAATDSTLSGADRYPVDVAVWQAIGDAVGDGVAIPPDSQESTGTDVPVSGAGSVVAQIVSGPLAVQPLRATPIVSLDRNPRGVDAVALDRAEVVVIFGHVAPANVAAPNPGYNFRLVSRFADGQLAGEATRLDVAYTATEALLDAAANVISVDTSEGEAPVRTVVEVSDESLVAAAGALDALFGPVDVRVTDTRIAGVDAVVTLGTDYLARLGAGAQGSATTPPSPASTTPGTTS